MKLKFVLVLLVVLGFAIVGCSNDSSENEPKKEELKWISPIQETCKANGGKIDNDICKANWSNAKDICSASGGRLATIDELKKVVTDCGGIIDDYANKADSVYQDCYKRKGFSPSNYYWSSTTYASNTSYAWNVSLRYCDADGYHKSANGYVRCVRAGQ